MSSPYVMTMAEIIDPKYRGTINVRDPFGEPKAVWRCDHVHADYLEATNCANEHLSISLNLPVDDGSGH